MAANRIRITKRSVDALKSGEKIWDNEVIGFGARRQVRATSYFLKKNINGRQRWLTIGKHGEPWTPDTARDEAKVLLGKIAAKEDPAQSRDQLRGRATVSDMIMRFIEEYAKEHKKPSSVKLDQMNYDNHIKPILGHLYVNEVTMADVDHFKRSVKTGKSARDLPAGKILGSPVKGGPGAANRSLALLSTAFNQSIKWGWRSDNPATRVEKYKENKRERYLSANEFAALAEALNMEEMSSGNPYPVAAIKLLIFTGARRGEILSLKWNYVDLDRGILALPTSKTGAKKIFLNTPAIEVLSKIPRQKDNPFVICGGAERAHLVNLRKVWQRVTKMATDILRERANEQAIVTEHDMTDVRIHDLRHSFASVAVMDGISLPMIGKLLGHTQPNTTARYAHLADDPVRAASETIANKLDLFLRR